MKNLKIKFGLFSLLAVLAVSVFLTSCEQQEILSDLPEVQLKNYELFTLNSQEIFNEVKKQNSSTVQVKLPYDNLSFELEEINIFDEDMKTPFYTIEKDGTKIPVEIPEIHFYGNKKGAEETVFMSMLEDEFRLEYTKKGKSYTIVPATDILDDQPKGKYIAYDSEELIDAKVEMDCLHTETEEDIMDSDNLNLELSERAGYYKLRVGGIIDYAMYQHYGHNGAVSQVLNQVANANQIFANNGMNIDIIWGGGYIDSNNTLRPTTETYYSQTFFNQWAAWATGTGAWARAWNVDNFFVWTGHWLQNTGAMGSTGYCCRSNYYTSGFMNMRKANNGGWTWKNRVLAHEIGHSLGAHHDSGLMAWNTASGTFSWNSKNQINNHLSWYSSCLHD